MNSTDGKRKKVAAVITEYRYNAHADVIAGRLLKDFDYHPEIDVVSMYTDQVPDNDMSREMAEKNGVPIYPTIEEAITVGNTGTTIDGVVIVGEHGDYPMNEKRIKEYPRRRLLEGTLAALDKNDLHVPIFSDKHFSYNIDDTMWMYEQLKKRDIPYMGGSSIPWTIQLPVYNTSDLKDTKEILVVSFSKSIEAYGFHGLEVLQSLAEKRAGGETGVQSIQGIEGEALWQAMDRGEWPEDLLLKALEVNPEAPAGHPRESEPDAFGFMVEYTDGTRGYLIQLMEWVKQWGFAFRTDDGKIVASRHVSDKGRPHRHFATFTRMLEELMITGKPPFPMEKTLLTSGMTNYGMESLYTGERLETPELKNIHYQL